MDPNNAIFIDIPANSRLVARCDGTLFPIAARVTTKEALLYDAISLFSQTVQAMQIEAGSAFDPEAESWEYGLEIIDRMKKVLKISECRRN